MQHNEVIDLDGQSSTAEWSWRGERVNVWTSECCGDRSSDDLNSCCAATDWRLQSDAEADTGGGGEDERRLTGRGVYLHICTHLQLTLHLSLSHTPVVSVLGCLSAVLMSLKQKTSKHEELKSRCRKPEEEEQLLHMWWSWWFIYFRFCSVLFIHTSLFHSLMVSETMFPHCSHFLVSASTCLNVRAHLLLSWLCEALWAAAQAQHHQSVHLIQPGVLCSQTFKVFLSYSLQSLVTVMESLPRTTLWDPQLWNPLVSFQLSSEEESG